MKLHHRKPIDFAAERVRSGPGATLLVMFGPPSFVDKYGRGHWTYSGRQSSGITY